MDLYLITGFLGAGKTSFLKQFVRTLAPRKLRLLINEFGRVGVDGVLLKELGAVMDEINNGSIFCACLSEEFEAKLADIAQSDAEAVVVEASGLSDPTHIREILGERAYETIAYRGAVCLVDAPRFQKVYSTAAVCPRQLAVSDLILINKTDTAPPDLVAEIRALLHERCPAAAVYETTFGQCRPEWLEYLQRSQAEKEAAREEAFHACDLTLQEYAMHIQETMPLDSLERFIRMFIDESYRVKGFVRLEGRHYFVDCVGPVVEIKPWEDELPLTAGVLVALAGKGMNLRKALRQAAEWYPGQVEIIKTQRGSG